MSTSNVRNIDSLVLFRSGLLKLSSNWEKVIQEMQMTVHRCNEHFSQTMPAYWNRQTQLAERELTEAKDQLAQKRAAVRAADRPAATEAFKRVQIAERRLRVCQEKQRIVKSVAVEISRECDKVLGPLADVNEHCETLLPSAAFELQTLIDHLKKYAEQADKTLED